VSDFFLAVVFLAAGFLVSADFFTAGFFTDSDSGEISTATGGVFIVSSVGGLNLYGIGTDSVGTIGTGVLAAGSGTLYGADEAWATGSFLPVKNSTIRFNMLVSPMVYL